MSLQEIGLEYLSVKGQLAEEQQSMSTACHLTQVQDLQATLAVSIQDQVRFRHQQPLSAQVHYDVLQTLGRILSHPPLSQSGEEEPQFLTWDLRRLQRLHFSKCCRMFPTAFFCPRVDAEETAGLPQSP
jgi:hypothetical protein